MDIGVGERGRNRAFNLLFGSQTLNSIGFSDFPTAELDNLRQK